MDELAQKYDNDPNLNFALKMQLKKEELDKPVAEIPDQQDTDNMNNKKKQEKKEPAKKDTKLNKV